MYKLSEKKYGIILMICLSIFLIICIATSLYYGDKLLLGDIETYNNDDVKYLRSAQTLIDTGKLTYRYPDQKTVFIMPGIIFLITPFVYFFGQIGAIVAFRIFSALLQTFTMYVLFLLFRKVFNSNKIALLTVILNIIYVANIYVTTILLSETAFFAILINLIYVCIFAVEQKKIKYYVIGGIIWAISVLFKPIMLVFPINILVLMIINKYKFKEMVTYALIPIAIVLAVMIPWWVRNYISFNQFIPLTLSSGNPKLQGAYINYDQEPSYKNEMDFSGVEIDYSTEVKMNETETKLADIVIKYNLKNNTLQYLLWNTVGKTIENFKGPFIWYPLYGIDYKILFIPHYIYLVLGGVGIIITIFNKKYKENKTKYMLMSTIVFFNIVYLPFYCFSRYVYPIMPILIGFAAIAILEIVCKIIKCKEKMKEKVKGE